MDVLVIEDSRFLRTAIERALTRAGHTAIGVEDGRDGLRSARDRAPDLILLDMMLPGLDGIAVLKELQQDETTRKIPVVVLTGLSQRNEPTLIKAGASTYLQKGNLDLDKGGEKLVLTLEKIVNQQTIEGDADDLEVKRQTTDAQLSLAGRNGRRA